NKELISAGEAQMAILIGFSTNAISKIVSCCAFGNSRYMVYTVTGIVLVTLATWLGVFLHPV
ncbi:MAG: hypothetical protein ACO22R_09010, partial [Chitinophagaceae bacterium]